MSNKRKGEGNKNVFYIFLLLYILSIVSLIIIFRPFLYALIMGGVFGIFFFPLNKYLQRRGISAKRSSLMLVFLIFILIIAGSFFFVNSLVKEATSTYRSLAGYDFADVDLFVENTLGFEVSTREIALVLMDNLNEALSASIIEVIGSLADVLIGLFVMLFLLYYIFKDGDHILMSIMDLVPLSKSHKDQISVESKKILYGVMYGQLLIAILQGILGGLAFFAFGLSNPVFWGFIMAILAFIPILGTPAVWAPAGILEIMYGSLWGGIGLLLFGSIVMFSIENILRPRIIGKRSGMHPILVLLSIFGGIKLFGVIGLIIGPIAVALCVLVIKFFNREVLSINK